MRKESKIILVSGITITFEEGDEVSIVYETNETEGAIVMVDNIKDIPKLVMNKTGDIVINHKLKTGEYMEYYLTREKITWCYYAEILENRNETGK